MDNPLNHLETIFQHRPHFRSVGKGIALAALVGMVAGLGAILFHLLCLFVGHWALDAVAGYRPEGPAGEAEIFAPTMRQFLPWLLLLVPTIGGLVSGFLVFTFAPEAEGHGTDSAIDSYHNKRGMIRPRVPIIKMLASAITLGTGGSGGREGPIAQIGAGFGSLLATKLGLSDSERRVLMAAGLGAGIAAIFHAPLAGAIFAIEVLYRDPDFEAEALIPSFIACTIAYCVFGLAFGFHPLFTVKAFHFDQPFLLIPLTLLAVAMSLASLIYVKSFYGFQKLFHKMPLPNHIKPAIGGFATGAVALILFFSIAAFNMGDKAQSDSLSVLSFGYGFLQDILQINEPISHAVVTTTAVVTDAATTTTAIADHTETTGVMELIHQNKIGSLMLLLIMIGVGKIITTGLTIGSGGSGGVFGPSMVIGGALGAVVGLCFQYFMPDTVTRIDVFVILGMASFFAAAANTPVSTLIMVSEMTGNYQLLLPSMWVCALAYLISRGWSIYIQQVQNRMESPAHRGDYIIDILEGLTIKHALTDHHKKFITVPPEMTLNDVVHMITDTRQTTFPVINKDQACIGIFALNDVRQFLYDTDMGELATAEDLAAQVEPLFTTAALDDAIGRFAVSRFEELPIFEPENDTHVIAMLRRVDVIAAYNKQLIKVRADQDNQ